MKTPEKKFRFCIEPQAAIATLEQVLAIVRRLDIDLLALRTTGTPHGMEVLLTVAADSEDVLVLCRMRLHNVIGVLPIRELVAAAPANRPEFRISQSSSRT